MTALAFVAAAACGGLLRWATVRWWHCNWQALLGVNVAGSMVLGWVVGADVSAATVTVVGAAFAGSLTTFSSFALEAVRLRPAMAATFVGATTVSCLVAASIAASL